MKLLKEAEQEKRFDARVVERNLQRNIVSHDEMKSHVSGLPDDSHLGEWINLETLKDSDS